MPLVFKPKPGVIYNDDIKLIDEKSKEEKYANVVLSDDLRIDLGGYVNMDDHERDLVDIIKMESSGKLESLKPKDAKSGGACNLL